MPIYFSTNPTDWFALEGVYIAEMDQPGGANIDSSAGLVKIVGEFPWGPTGTMERITTSSQFRDTFMAHTESPENYKGFRSIAGKQWGELEIVRVADDGQEKASVTLDDDTDDAYEIEANHVGAVGDEIEYDHTDNTDGTFDLTVTWGDSTESWSGLELDDLEDDLEGDFVTVKLIDENAGVPDDEDGNLSGGDDGDPDDSDYADGLDALKSGDEGGVVFAAEYTSDAWIADLQSHVDDMRSMGIAQAHEGDDFEDSVDAAGDISDESLIPCSHRVKQFVESELTKVDLAPFVASVMANSPPHVSPAAYRNREWLRPIQDFADGVSLGRADYIAAKNAGAIALERADGNWTIKSGVTSDTTQIATRRMKDLVSENMAQALAPFQSEPPYESNVNGGKASMEKRLDRLAGDESNPDSQMIEDYQVDIVDVSPDSVQYRVDVKLWGAMDHIIAHVLVGENVVINDD